MIITSFYLSHFLAILTLFFSFCCVVCSIASKILKECAFEGLFFTKHHLFLSLLISRLVCFVLSLSGFAQTRTIFFQMRAFSHSSIICLFIDSKSNLAGVSRFSFFGACAFFPRRQITPFFLILSVFW